MGFLGHTLYITSISVDNLNRLPNDWKYTRFLRNSHKRVLEEERTIDIGDFYFYRMDFLKFSHNERVFVNIKKNQTFCMSSSTNIIDPK